MKIPANFLPLRCAFALACAALCLKTQSDCRADATYNFALNTTAIAGISGNLAFDLTNGDAVAFNNRVVISNFSTNAIGLTTTSFFLTDGPGFNTEILRPLTFGTFLNFSLQVTTNFAGGAPDEFSFFLLNAAGTLTLRPTSDPTGSDAIFIIDIKAPPITAVYTSVTPATLNVPDQGSTFLLLLVSITSVVFWKFSGKFQFLTGRSLT